MRSRQHKNHNKIWSYGREDKQKPISTNEMVKTDNKGYK